MNSKPHEEEGRRKKKKKVAFLKFSCALPSMARSAPICSHSPTLQLLQVAVALHSKCALHANTSCKALKEADEVTTSLLKEGMVVNVAIARERNEQEWAAPRAQYFIINGVDLPSFFSLFVANPRLYIIEVSSFF